ASSACTPGSRRLPSPVSCASRTSGSKPTAHRVASRPHYTAARMRVGIVGLGYVGLPLAVAFAAADVDVIGVDLDEAKVAAIAAGRSHVEDVPDRELAAALPQLVVTADYARLAEADAV